MFARFFPMNRSKVIQETYLGILNSLILYPISYIAPNIEEGLSGIYTNTKFRLMAPFDADKRERYRQKIFEEERNTEKNYKPKPWEWQLMIQRLLLNPQFYYLHSIIIAPIVEELIFRGLLMPFIGYVLEAADINPSYSIILTSLAFGLLHNEGMKLGATCSGYMWANMAAQNNGSLWSSLAGHISQNAIGEVIYHYQRP